LRRISVDANGNAWGVNGGGSMYRHDGSNWHHIPGTGVVDIGVGADNDVWVVNSVDEVFKLNDDGSTWTRMPGALASIAVGHSNNVWGTNSGQSIY